MGGGGVIRSSVISLTNFPPRNNRLTAQHQGPDRQLGQSKRGMNHSSARDPLHQGRIWPCEEHI